MKINKRLKVIIETCQRAKKRYGFDYELRYNYNIKRFSDEIIKGGLVDKSKDVHTAKQLCIMNNLEY